VKTEINYIQGSPEWNEWRKGSIGSSEIVTIMGLNPYEKIEDLWLVKTGQKPPKDLSKNFAVLRGSSLEPVARNLFNEISKKKFEPACFNHDKYPFVYSSDGVFENEIIEIKCMGARNHFKVISEKQVIPYYLPQVYWGMMLSGADVCHFVSYNPEFEENIVSIEVKKDEAYFDAMIAKAVWFYECVNNKINPLHAVLDLNAVNSVT